MYDMVMYDKAVCDKVVWKYEYRLIFCAAHVNNDWLLWVDVARIATCSSHWALTTGNALNHTKNTTAVHTE